MLRPERLEQAFVLEPQRIEDFIVPEKVAPGPAGLGDDRGGQANRLGALDVELREDPDAGLLAQVTQDRLGKLLVECRVDHDRLAGRPR